MRKTNNRQLLKELEETPMSYQYLSETSPLNSVSIIDFTTLAQSLINSRFETFGEIAKSLALIIFLNFQFLIAVIPDRYDVKDSIKFYERSQRERYQTLS